MAWVGVVACSRHRDGWRRATNWLRAATKLYVEERNKGIRVFWCLGEEDWAADVDWDASTRLRKSKPIEIRSRWGLSHIIGKEASDGRRRRQRAVMAWVGVVACSRQRDGWRRATNWLRAATKLYVEERNKGIRVFWCLGEEDWAADVDWDGCPPPPPPPPLVCFFAMGC
ncbi:hypothetical protein Drorol1_Dr00023979, partial [Drosera rotundifolia]